LQSGNFSTLPQHFLESGYYTASVGKIFHPLNTMKTAGNTDDYPYSWSIPGWHPPTHKDKGAKVCNGTDSVQGNDGQLHVNAVCPVTPEDQPGGSLPDLQSTAQATTLLRQFAKVQQTQLQQGKAKQPFFLGVGYHKPHIPLKYPAKYRDLYPLDKVPLPAVRTKPAKMPPVAWDSWDDVRSRDDVTALNVSWPYGPMPDDFSKRMRQSYYACISYIDDQVGELMSVLDETGLDKDTGTII
jgi:iduronate 2-sulfatase